MNEENIKEIVDEKSAKCVQSSTLGKFMVYISLIIVEVALS